jgi:hypothetical protein
MLSVIMLSAIMLNIIMLSVIILLFRLNVTMPSVQSRSVRYVSLCSATFRLRCKADCRKYQCSKCR